MSNVVRVKFFSEQGESDCHSELVEIIDRKVNSWLAIKDDLAGFDLVASTLKTNLTSVIKRGGPTMCNRGYVVITTVTLLIQYRYNKPG